MRSSKLLVLALALSIATTACPAGYFNVCDDGACDAVDASSDSPPDVRPDVAGCDLAKEPKDSLPCLDDSIGVFVSPTGSDSNDGTKAKPVATLGKALAIVANKPRIYVCEGTYAEDLTINKSVSMYGGFACSTWGYTGTKPVVGKSSTPLRVSGVSVAMTLEDLDVRAASGASAGESSIGATILNSTVSFVRMKLAAGKGQPGASPAQPGQSSKATDGVSSIGSGGGGPCSNVCSDGTSLGGKGSDVGNGNADPGLPFYGGTYPNNGGKGTDSTACGSGGGGGVGVAGSAASLASGATTLGTVTTSWTPTSGATGAAGARGQGGGGGGARAGGGGGGGCGGCGGAGGPGGGGGGASIAVLAISSNVTLSESELAASDAGSGGKGALGALGQPPGAGGNGFTASPSGCAGGDGGQGGGGGAGGGGSGGVSVGILYKGTKPTTDTATDGKITFGTKGNKGLGGSSPTNDGLDGVAQAVLQAP